MKYNDNQFVLLSFYFLVLHVDYIFCTCLAYDMSSSYEMYIYKNVCMFFLCMFYFFVFKNLVFFFFFSTDVSFRSQF